MLAAYLSEYGDVEDIITSKSSSGTAHIDYIVTMFLDRKGFQAISQTLDYEEQTMMVVVEGNKPQCCFCKQLGHFSRSCPQNTTKTIVTTPTTTTTTTTTIAAKFTPPTKESPQPEAWDHPDKEEEGWTQVTGKKKKSPSKKALTENLPITTKITTAATVKSSSSKTMKETKTPIEKHATTTETKTATTATPKSSSAPSTTMKAAKTQLKPQLPLLILLL